MILACDKHKNVAVLNPSRLDKWISNDNTDINKCKHICIHKCIYNYPFMYLQLRLKYNYVHIIFERHGQYLDISLNYDFRIKTMFGSSIGGIMSCLCCLCMFVHSGVQHILCCVFTLFFFVLCALCCHFLWIVHF